MGDIILFAAGVALCAIFQNEENSREAQRKKKAEEERLSRPVVLTPPLFDRHRALHTLASSPLDAQGYSRHGLFEAHFAQGAALEATINMAPKTKPTLQHDFSARLWVPAAPLARALNSQAPIPLTSRTPHCEARFRLQHPKSVHSFVDVRFDTLPVDKQHGLHIAPHNEMDYAENRANHRLAEESNAAASASASASSSSAAAQPQPSRAQARHPAQAQAPPPPPAVAPQIQAPAGSARLVAAWNLSQTLFNTSKKASSPFDTPLGVSLFAQLPLWTAGQRAAPGGAPVAGLNQNAEAEPGERVEGQPNVCAQQSVRPARVGIRYDYTSNNSTNKSSSSSVEDEEETNTSNGGSLGFYVNPFRTHLWNAWLSQDFGDFRGCADIQVDTTAAQPGRSSLFSFPIMGSYGLFYSPSAPLSPANLKYGRATALHPTLPSYELGLQWNRNGQEMIASYFHHLVVRRKVKNPFERANVVGIHNYLDVGLEMVYKQDGSGPTVRFASSWQLNKNSLLKFRVQESAVSALYAFKSWWNPSASLSLSAHHSFDHGYTHLGLSFELENLGSVFYQKSDPEYRRVFANESEDVSKLVREDPDY